MSSNDDLASNKRNRLFGVIIINYTHEHEQANDTQNGSTAALLVFETVEPVAFVGCGSSWLALYSWQPGISNMETGCCKIVSSFSYNPVCITKLLQFKVVLPILQDKANQMQHKLYNKLLTGCSSASSLDI